MDGSFTSGLTYPLFIEIKNNLDGLVTFSTTDNSLSQQLELILAEPLYDESQQAADIKVEKMDEDDDSNIDVKDFLRYNKNITDNDDKKLNDNDNTKNNAISTTIETPITTTTTATINSTLPVTTISDNNDEKIYKCNDCSENFDTKEIYDIHMSGHANNMKCAICNMVLKSLKNYEKHCLRCKPYECQICGRIVRFRPNFIKHMRVHTGQQSERHKYKCEVCQKEFMSFEYFKVHKKIHNENVNLKCDVCGKVFSALASLRGHTKLHTGIKLHKCEICGKGFGQRYNLKIHSRVHTGEIPYECGICKRKMHTQSSYQNHMQTYHQKDKGSQTTSTIISDKTKTNEKIFKIKIKKDLKNDIKNSIDKNEKNEIKIKVERETQTVVQNNDDKIRNNCIVIPTKIITKSTTATKTTLSSSSSSSATTTTLPLSAPATIVSDTTLSNDIYETLIHNNETIKEGPVELCNNLIKYTTTNNDLLKLNSMNPKINEIIITKTEVNDNDNDNDNDDDDDDDNTVDNNIILGNKCTNKILINNTGDCNKFHNNDFENDFIIKTNKVVDDDDLMLNHCLSYTNIFETNTISNSIITDGIYLKYENNHDDNDDIDNDNCVNNLQSTTNTTDIGINSATTTDGNFIKKEWIYSNTTSNTNYSSITKFDVDDDDEFSEAASFVYD